MTRKTSRRLYNPFPGSPSNIGFLKGDLIYDHAVVPSEIYAAGNHGFLLQWRSGNGRDGCLSVHHKEDPERALWLTKRGHAFISAALGDEIVRESRGSFAIHDKAELLLTHQTIELLQVVSAEGGYGGRADEKTTPYEAKIRKMVEEFFDEAVSAHEADGDGERPDVQYPMVVITGCLYGDPKFAASQLRAFYSSAFTRTGPFYCNNETKTSQVGARYWLFFYQKRDHHLGFYIKLEKPMKQEPQHVSLALYHSKRVSTDYIRSIAQKNPSSLAYYYLQELFWLWSSLPLSAFENRGSQSYTSARFHKPLATLKRLIVSDMFKFKRSIKAAIYEEDHAMNLPLSEDFRNCITTRSADPANGSEEENHVGREVEFSLNRIVLTYASDSDEQFFGFGEQFSFFNLKGKRVPIMVQEQGLGRGDQPITAAVNLVAERCGGDWHNTYAPMPYYITSKSRSLFLEEYNYSVFDLTKSDYVQVQVHGGEMKGRILHGQNPLQLIERYTEAAGRMKELPDWILEGAVVGMQGGTSAVRETWKKLEDIGVPISAFWLQDWCGQRKTSIGWQLWWNWEVDKEHYAGWNELVRDLQHHGINTLAYVNPFLAQMEDKPHRCRDMFAEAKSQGYLVKTSTGSPYMIQNTSFDAAMVDLTNEDACKWLKDVMRAFIQTGIKGWMADFGESLPFDGKLSSGEDPKVLHNKYPEMWAKLNREVIDECGDDLVFFMRSAYLKSPRWATLFWEGDQMVSWQRHDGIKSAVTGLLSSGISGLAYNHSDIGGYCTVDLPFLRYRRSEELLFRWIELNAFSVVFRTHEGNLPGVNCQFHSTNQSLQHFSRFAKVYKAWAFYRKLLVKEAANKGLPIVRHMFLHYADDPQITSISYEQFLIGTEIMVVPVLDKGHKFVWAYFPKGNDAWIHIWSRKIYETRDPKRGERVRIHAPIGYPAVFVRKDSQIGQTFMKNLEDLNLHS
ncbi:hypothetical protein KP509_04G100900 [Ceratopteris richardii]|uniref:Alpha-glucosidase n=1 Tax=Ceratopteris richardii TaxID=49495 RepID=A0A8T2UVP3_CERRI|nr:hypothetical protein KP509_04G100900 [Ceratopteris richardii]